MTIIWGLDLHELQWSKLKTSHMFARTAHPLRRTKLAVYQAAMILMIVAESLGTAALSDFTAQHSLIATHLPGATLRTTAFTAAAACTTVVGVLVATVFGAAFFFDVFWPARTESRGVRTAWRACSALAAALACACACAGTYVVAAMGGVAAGADAVRVAEVLAVYGGGSVRYRGHWRAVASVVVLWLGTVCTVVSAGVMWGALARGERVGMVGERAGGVGKAEGTGVDDAVETGVDGVVVPPHAVPDAGARV